MCQRGTVWETELGFSKEIEDMDRWGIWTEIEPRPKFRLYRMQEVLMEESQEAGFLCSLL